MNKSMGEYNLIIEMSYSRSMLGGAGLCWADIHTCDTCGSTMYIS